VSAAHQVSGLASIVLGAQLQEHQRAAGPWHAEWEPLRTALALTIGAAERLADVLDALEVDVDRMRANVGLTEGLVMTEAVTTALVAQGVDAAQARRAVEAAADAALSGRGSLADALAVDAVVASALDRQALEHALEPREHLGAADAFIDHALAHAKISPDASRGAP
jgi:3-carboxy-cis,cis-muconate cycloisomerase